MTTRELIERLTEMVEFEPSIADAPVRLQTQSNYPLEYAIYGLTTKSSIEELKCEDEDASTIPTPKQDSYEDVVYIVEGSQIGYGDRDAWEAAGMMR